MPWKKDLAKLKQELKNEDPPPAPKASPVRRAEKPEAPADLEGEDAVFLAAMGRRAPKPAAQDRPVLPEPLVELSAAVPVVAKDVIAPPSVPSKAGGDESFAGAMAALKGVTRTVPRYAELEAKRVSAPNAKVVAKAQAPAPVAVPAPVPAVPAEPLPPVPAPEPAPSSLVEDKGAKKPVLIQLAAGMAVDVDGTLDLRGHSSQDALERLKERVLDGQALGWRTLHLHLGNDPGLAEAFESFISGPIAVGIARYAQAPIPMGGAQARILYFSGVVPGTKEGV